MPEIIIRFAGICCFVEKHSANDPFVRRVVMPLDTMSSQMGMDPHIPFIEFEHGDIRYPGNIPPSKQYTHYNGSIVYDRWELAGHFITIDTVDPTGPALKSTRSFDRHVPKMYKVCPDLQLYPRSECFDDDPDATLIAGCVDLNWGTLDATNLTEYLQPFVPQRRWGPERTPRYVELRLPVKPGDIVVTLKEFASSKGTGNQITLYDTTETITIGNLLEADISGPGSGKTTSEHFKLFYDLSDPNHYPANPSFPADPLVPVDSCSVTGWP